MDERIAVDAFERGACSERRFRIAAEEGRAFGDEKRPQPLAALSTPWRMAPSRFAGRAISPVPTAGPSNVSSSASTATALVLRRAGKDDLSSFIKAL